MKTFFEETFYSFHIKEKFIGASTIRIIFEIKREIQPLGTSVT